MKSSGAFACSVSVMKLFQESGRRDRITSPVAGSCRMKTSLPSKRNSEGRRTAWLRPLRNSFAVRAIGGSSKPLVYTTVYYILGRYLFSVLIPTSQKELQEGKERLI